MPILVTPIPSFIRKRLLRLARNELMRDLYASEARIKKVQLEPRHVQNLQCLPTRTDLLSKCLTGGRVAELGVDNVDFSADILRTLEPAQLHLVDPWASDRYHKGKQESVQRRFAREIADEIIEVHAGLSTECADNFEEGSLDLVYIDTNHSYKTTARELCLYAPKVRAGGFLAGHDYILGNWSRILRYGVIEAVHEFCLEEGWEFVYLTMEQVTPPSFALRKLQ